MAKVYTPDIWVVIEFLKDGELVNESVLGGWYGGFAGGNSWKLSSMIVDTKEFDTHYEFTTHTGSKYQCFKACTGMSMYTKGIFDELKRQEVDGRTVSVKDY